MSADEEPATTAIDERLVLDEDALLAMLGAEVAPQSQGLDPKVLIAIGRAWLEDNWDALRHAVCGNSAIRVARETTGSFEAIVVTAVADAIAGIARGFAVFTAAVLLIKYGLDRLCA